MSLNQLNVLYKEVVLDHAQNPRNKRKILSSEKQLAMQNPTCGDYLNISIKTRQNAITEISFDGWGCTISQASASMMTETLINKNIDDAISIIYNFSKMITGQKVDNSAVGELGDASVLATMAEFPTRIKCATLAWHIINDLLKNEKGNVYGKC
ncbi:Fe-S cluster assembly sulfur transfer protein SufU [Companilactobacillus sp. HBUAS59544]|uniref:Fe-S cluster assembly sulfur transfer protein SufU n=1 Tax=Companilactobacillus sp. HBUAS59544 TaxID=3109363 RepID=UPI002FF392FA